jgi:predicted RNA binding protein YcfA (HicA-like mRNA interferase family)
VTKLPRELKPKKVLAALKRAGFVIDHVTGAHYILIKGSQRISVPYHGSVKTGTLRSILKQAGISIDDFVKLL